MADPAQRRWLPPIGTREVGMTRIDDNTHYDKPPLLRLILFLGKPFGIAFVPQHHVQVIYRMGKYAGVRGPGMIYYSRLTETLGPMVLIKGQRNEYVFENIVARDVLPVTFRVAT